MRSRHIQIIHFQLKYTSFSKIKEVNVSGGRTYRLREKFAPSSRRLRAYRLETVVIEVAFDIS